MEGIHNLPPLTVDDVFRDFNGRRAGLIKALTTEVRTFYQQCDPEEENLYLYGHPNETWEVKLPVEQVPSELPEPLLGINFARDQMQVQDWLSLVAVHNNSWLIRVAFYFGARFGFGKSERNKLFQKINNVPTLYEVVAGKSCVKKSQPKGVKMMTPPKQKNGNGEEKEEEDEQGATCGACGDRYANDEFWICCNVCERSFHGECVKITPAQAAHIKHYKCPSCGKKRARDNMN